MTVEKIYIVLSYLLMVPAILMGISSVMSLAIALTNPILLLFTFILVCVVLYSFFSLKFARQVLVKNLPVKASLKDWIKVNAIGSSVFAFILVSNFFNFITTPSVQFTQQITQALQAQPTSLPVGISISLIVKIFSIAMYLFSAYGILLLMHIIISYSFLRKYKEYFTA